MHTILKWGGQDPPVKGDFTSNRGAFTAQNAINRMGVAFISENHDNFRPLTGDATESLVDYVQHQN